MRLVSDILDFAGPVAFDEVKHGTYQPVCPWCAKNLSSRIDAQTYGELYEALLDVQVRHMESCEQKEAAEMAVVLKPRQIQN